MRRLEGWELRLSAYLNKNANTPFVWGENDCLLFCAGAVKEITGIDLAEAERGEYDDAEGAAVYGDVEKILNNKLGLPLSNKNYAKRGDVATVKINGFLCAGVVDDSGAQIALMTEKGLCRIPLSCANNVWGVA